MNKKEKKHYFKNDAKKIVNKIGDVFENYIFSFEGLEIALTICFIVIGILMISNQDAFSNNKTNNNLEDLVTVDQNFDNSLLQFRDETEFELFYSYDLKKEKIINHTEYKEESPVYLTNVPEGQNIRYLRNRIKNDNISFMVKGCEHGLNDNMLLSTGMQIVVKINGVTTDVVNIVIIGDTTGDGKVNMFDRWKLKRTINFNENKGSFLLSCDIDNDGQLTKNDLSAIKKLY